jgi:hypothetical protein
MCWPLLAAVAFAIAYYQVGTMTVWVTVLSLALKVALLLGACLIVTLAAVAVRRRAGGR